MRRTLSLLSALALSLVLALALAVPAPGHAQENRDRSDGDPLPLPVDRTHPIDLTEGSWISLDVSPDGRTIVFDYLGSLFTIPFEGGEATRLTSGMAFDAQPRFSPDGERIVFTSDRSGGQNVWIISLDGTDTLQVTRGASNRTESPEWTPDGQYIVASVGDFRGSTQPTLRMYHVDGGTGVRILDSDDSNKALGAAFGPDDRYIWYAQRTGGSDWTYNAQLPQYQVRQYDRETGQSFTRTSRVGSGFRPALSPDGRWLVYGTRHHTETGLVLRDLENGEERWLAYPVQNDDQESRATLDVLPGMAFTPDSRWLVASYGGKIWRVPVEGGDAVEIPFRVRFDLELGARVAFEYPVDDAPAFMASQIRDAVPSPDGSRIAFVAVHRLWVANADGTNPRRLTRGEDSEHQPAWSPDGRWIAYTTWDGHGGSLMRVRSDGSGSPERLTPLRATYLSPAWSPDGRRIVALRGPARAFRENPGAAAAIQAVDEFVYVPAGGGEATVVAPRQGRSDPHFTQDPDRIWLSGPGGHLVSMRWDGTDERTHARVQGGTPPGSASPQNASLVRMAPRGDQALAMVGRQIYTVSVPRVGGDPPTLSVADPERSQVPARQLTDMGGEFPAWSADGRKVHWSLGAAHFVYDLDEARAHEEAAREREREEAREGEPGGAPADEPADDPADDPADEPADGAPGAPADPDADPDAAADAASNADATADATSNADAATREADDEDDAYRPTEFRVDVPVERDLPTGVAVLQGARIITMNGDEVIERGDVVVRNHRIEAVGPTGQVQVPEGARVVDLSGHTIVPGFVDTHAHLRPARDLHREDLWVYLANLAYGVTTTRDPQTGSTDVLAYQDLVEAGRVPGPRIYHTGPGIFWGEGFDSLDDTRTILRRYAEYWDTKTLKMYVAGNRQQRQWIIMASRELELMPTTEGSLNIRQNLNETLDGYPGLEHSLPIHPIYRDYVELFVATGRVYSPTLLVAYGGPWAENWFFANENVYHDPKLRRFTPEDVLARVALRRGQWFHEDAHVFRRHARFVADLVEAGGKAGVGSHGQLQGLGFHWELWAMASGGLSNHDALKVATLHGAEAIGMAGDLGSIEAGKLADLVILEENPLDDLRNTNAIRYVMKNGRLYEGDTLTEIYPDEGEIQELWWWDQEPVGVPGVGTGR